MPEEQQPRIFYNASQLKVGQSPEEVARLFGPPFEDELGSGPVVLCAFRRRPAIRIVTYYFAKRELNVANDFDPSVSIVHSEDAKLMNSISNINAVPTITSVRTTDKK